jgi:hypothetical protein
MYILILVTIVIDNCNYLQISSKDKFIYEEQTVQNQMYGHKN